MLDKLMSKYQKLFNQDITLPLFLELDEEEKIKILRQCLILKQKIYENDYFNNNYMEENK